MPKKTRKQKQRAQKRRTTSVETSSPSTPAVMYQLDGNAIRTPSLTRQSLSNSDAIELTVIRRDILKTTMLAISAVALELIIFWKSGGRW